MTQAADPHRRAHMQAFLEGAGWGAAEISLLAGDASNRRYLRLSGSDGQAVLMDAPPDTGEDTRPFIAVTDWLRMQRLSQGDPADTPQT